MKFLHIPGFDADHLERPRNVGDTPNMTLPIMYVDVVLVMEPSTADTAPELSVHIVILPDMPTDHIISDVFNETPIAFASEYMVFVCAQTM